LDKLTIPYLESLSTGELIDLADKRGLDIPPGLERVFIIEELLYLDHNEGNAEQGDIFRGDMEHHDTHHHEFREYVTLPRQYHISFIEVLIRDPLWAFVFWEIKTYDREQFEKAESFEGYCLRVTPLREGPAREGAPREDALKEGRFQPDEAASFIVAVDKDDNGRYLGFPPDNGRCFKVELCMLNYGNLTALAESRPFTLPCLIEPKLNAPVAAVYSNPLAKLSGVDRFLLVRSEDRLLRPRDIKR
jgi:hypothetical protein